MFQNDSYASEATRGIHEANGIAKHFFSGGNIDKIQEYIRIKVFRESGQRFNISRQDDNELKIIMRHIYLTHGTYQNFMVDDEVNQLNDIVVNYCTTKILPEIYSYLKYTNDIDSTPSYMNHAENTSIKGSKVIEMKPMI